MIEILRRIISIWALLLEKMKKKSYDSSNSDDSYNNKPIIFNLKKYLTYTNERAWKVDQINMQNMGDTINFKAAMKARKSGCPLYVGNNSKLLKCKVQSVELQEILYFPAFMVTLILVVERIQYK